MSLKSLLKLVVRAAPIIMANAPAIVSAVREVRRAVKRAAPPQ